MARPLIVAAAALVPASLAFASHTAQACSCSAPRPHMLSPMREGKAPLNARVRVVVPTYLSGQLALRKHDGADVSVKRIDSPLQSSAHVELVPDKPLDADTRYDVAFVNPKEHPSTYIFGTFVTGNALDTTAPVAPKIGKAVVNAHRSSMMTSCAVHTPWVQVPSSGARDPDRDDARLLHAVWMSNSRGVVDLNAPPTAYLVENDGKIKLGRTSYCDPDEFPLPMAGSVTLSIAAIDEAGNRSAVQRVNFVIPIPTEAP